jgi:hypothetical protein
MGYLAISFHVSEPTLTLSSLWERCAPNPPYLLGEHLPGQRQPVKAGAARATA